MLPRDAMQARPVPSCGVCLSVRPSVRHVRGFCQNDKDIFKIVSPSGSHTILVFRTKRETSRQYSDGEPPNGGVECRWGRHKSRFWTNSWLSIDDCCSARSTIDGRRCNSVQQLRCTSVYGRDRHASVKTPKRTEQNIFVCSGKSEAEVTNNRSLHSMYCNIDGIGCTYSSY